MKKTTYQLLKEKEQKENQKKKKEMYQEQTDRNYKDGDRN